MVEGPKLQAVAMRTMARRATDAPPTGQCLMETCESNSGFEVTMCRTVYPVDMADSSNTLELDVTGMHCAGCVGNVQRALELLPGVTDVQVDLHQATATINGSIEASVAIQAVEAKGFSASLRETNWTPVTLRTDLEKRQHSAAQKWGWRAFLGIMVWVPLEILHWSMGDAHHGTWLPWVMFGGSTLAVVLVGHGFFQSAIRALRSGGTNMDTLVSIGVLTAWTYSVVLMVLSLSGVRHGQMTYFAEACALLAIISLGHWLEARATAKAGSAVRSLLEMQPDTAERIDEDDNVAEVPIEKIFMGDRLLVRPGARVAVDGTIIEGVSELDESVVTGEPIPVLRRVGEQITAGSINTTGRLVVKATVDGTGTTVARIADLVTHAIASKASIQRLADRASSIFVPVVLSIALVTIIGWSIAAIATGSITPFQTGLIAAVTVLVISCPCALGLATPMAVMVSASEAARNGILVKSAVALERAGQTQTVIFDKTGTLTAGHPKVADVKPEDGQDPDEVIRLAAAVESASEHPIARAIVDHASERSLTIPPVADFKAQPGHGVTGVVEGRTVEIVRDAVASCRVVLEGRTIGTITVSDELRKDAARSVADLQALRIDVHMLSGDRRHAALEIAEQAGISRENVHAEQTPEDKQSWIEHCSERTMMVGDGINDAAALAEADVGVAMATGTNIAVEAADVIIPGDKLTNLARTISIARMTRIAIRQNLFFAFVYNATLIPIAALGFLGASGPIWAAIAMGLSDVTVIGNAIRLGVRLRRMNRSDSSR